MVIYFSGTGNSKYVAEIIASNLNDSIISLNKRIKNNDTSALDVNRSLVIVTPTYAWRIPRIVEKHLNKTILSGTENVWFVMTCGGEIGNAMKYNRKWCKKHSLNYMGTKEIVMPENYIALFDAPNDTEAKSIIGKANPVIDQVACDIRDGKFLDEPKNSLLNSIYSDIINPFFYAFIVKSKKFIVSDECIGCKKCSELCPLNNIKMVNNRPEWGNRCTHCMECINHCPMLAIEYGKNSMGKPRYHID